MPAYLIADVIEVMDRPLMDSYAAGAHAAVQSHGGRYLIATPDAEILEGEWRPGTIVVLEFPDMATLTGWYHSSEYQELVKQRQQASRGNLVAVEGGDQPASNGAYVIADSLSVHDAEAIKEYQQGTPGTIAGHGGQFVIRGGGHEVLEGDWTPGRIVMVGLDDMSMLKNWYNFDDYQRLIKIRQAASENNLIAVEAA